MGAGYGWRAAASVLALLALASPVRAFAAPPGDSPNVLLITVDTLRRDALGWVAGRNETPNLDALARAGFRFPAAVSPVPMTLPAHCSIMTGALPRQHGIHDNGQVLGASLTTLAERLRAGGYSTAAFVSGYPLNASFGLDRGFSHYDDTMPEGVEGWVERRAAATTKAALAWIEGAPRPWFVWVHYFDPHEPYDPPRNFWQPGARGAYDGEVTYTDFSLGALLRGATASAAKSPARPEDAGALLTVFTADHGEGLGEHGERTHGYFVYDSTILVPLVFHWPGRVRSAASDLAARLVDVAPTVLDLVDLPPLSNATGRSLAATLTGHAQPAAAAFIETELPWRFFGWSPLTALRLDGWKLIVAPRPELYDLAHDAGEMGNRFDGKAGERRHARELRAEMRRFEALPIATAGELGDPEAVARLRALGYIGAGGGGGAPPAGLPDPKDRLAARDELMAADAAASAGRVEEALARFDRVLAEEPTNRFATLRSGVALLKAGKLEAAAERLERAVAADPGRAEARFALADALTRLGRHDQALPHWLELARLQPRRAEHWTNLGYSLRQNGQAERAAAAFREAAALAAERPAPKMP